jgi:uncharacterized phage protein (TIGR02220 family)
MEVLAFLNQLNTLNLKHKMVWIDIITNCLSGKLSLDSLLYKYGISKSTFFRLLSMQRDGFLYEQKKCKIKIKRNQIVLDVLSENEKPKHTPKPKQKETKIVSEVEQIISYLNSATGKSFSYKSKNSYSFINARLKEGYKIEDFKKVIDIKCHKWINTDFEAYLRPQTLFSNKMDGYLNESVIVKKDKVDKANDTISKAKQFDWSSSI